MHDAEKKLLRKLFVSKRNKRDWGLAKHVQHVNAEQERIQSEQAEREQHAARSRADAESGEQPAWMAKTHEARNRLNDKKRGSAERWNRFAGTSDSGGRGL